MDSAKGTKRVRKMAKEVVLFGILTFFGLVVWFSVGIYYSDKTEDNFFYGSKTKIRVRNELFHESVVYKGYKRILRSLNADSPRNWNLCSVLIRTENSMARDSSRVLVTYLFSCDQKAGLVFRHDRCFKRIRQDPFTGKTINEDEWCVDSHDCRGAGVICACNSLDTNREHIELADAVAVVADSLGETIRKHDLFFRMSKLERLPGSTAPYWFFQLADADVFKNISVFVDAVSGRIKTIGAPPGFL